MYNYQTPTKKSESPMRQQRNKPKVASGFGMPQRLPSPVKQPVPYGYKPAAAPKRVMTAYGQPKARPAPLLSARTRGNPHQPSPLKARGTSPVKRSFVQQAPAQSFGAKKSSYVQAL